MAGKSQTPICFVLREPKSKTPTPIYGIVRFNNERVKIGTGFKVLPNNWLADKARVKRILGVTNSNEINTYLRALEEEVDKIMNNLKSNRNEITKEVIRERIGKFLNPAPSYDKPRTLLEFVHSYIETCPTRLVRSKGSNAGRVISPNTVRRYKTTLNGLEAFSLEYPRSLSFNNIDSHFYMAFTEWLTAKNYATNNVSKYIENLKGFMTIAVDEGLTTNQEFRKFANMREDAENIYLTETELKCIYDLNLTKLPRLEKVRDLFIFACWTGLRFSDFSNLTNEHIHVDEEGHKSINIKQQKTGARVQIPILDYSVNELLEKYSNCLPAGISNQKTNDYLKEICRLADINKKVIKHITKGGKLVTKTSEGYTNKAANGVEKWELITTHTARRSFATNMFKRGMEPLYIMMLTGHQKESEFRKYIKVTPEDTLKRMRSYFKEKTK